MTHWKCCSLKATLCFLFQEEVGLRAGSNCCSLHCQRYTPLNLTHWAFKLLLPLYHKTVSTCGAAQIIWFMSISAQAASAEVNKRWQKGERTKKTKKQRLYLIPGEKKKLFFFFLAQAIWCLGSSPAKPRCGADKLCCLPEPRSHSFWSSPEVQPNVAFTF